MVLVQNQADRAEPPAARLLSWSGQAQRSLQGLQVLQLRASFLRLAVCPLLPLPPFLAFLGDCDKQRCVSAPLLTQHRSPNSKHKPANAALYEQQCISMCTRLSCATSCDRWVGRCATRISTNPGERERERENRERGVLGGFGSLHSLQQKA